MSSNIDPNQQPQPVEQPPAEGPPRDDSGRFAAASLPQTQAFGAPAPQQPSDAERFYHDFANPQSANEALLREAQRQGIVPQGMTLDDVRTAVSGYSEFQQQQFAPPAAPAPVPGYAQQRPAPPALQQQPFGGQQPPESGYVDFDPYEFQQATVQGVLSALDQREQQREQQRQQAEYQQRVSNLQAAIGSVAQEAGLDERQASDLLANVAFGVDEKMRTGQPVDFSREALVAETKATLDHLRAWGAPPAPQPTAEQQVAIAHHRGIAPQTVTPSGPAQVGAAAAPRGLAGAAQRIRQGQV